MSVIQENTSHTQGVLIDGLIVSNWSPALFAEMRKGGLSAANCTCSVWEDFADSMKEMSVWKERFHNWSDVVTQVYTVDDIFRAQAENKVGVILGWQNTSGFGSDLRTVRLFRELGLRVAQLTYHTANLSGSGCLESTDHGLTDFGHELISVMNDEGILIDLSHVGETTSLETIRASRSPVSYTHCAPYALKDHKRNKSDEALREIAQSGGIVGVTMFPPFMARGNDSTVSDYIDTIAYVIDLCGEEHVAIGTDFMLDYPAGHVDYFLRDQGVGRKLLVPTGPKFPPDFSRPSDYPNLVAAMHKAGWSTARMERVLGGNWIRIFREVWKS